MAYLRLNALEEVLSRTIVAHMDSVDGASIVGLGRGARLGKVVLGAL